MSLASRLYSKFKNVFRAFSKKILGSTFVKNFAAKYPRGYTFFLNRFTLDEFTGLPLTFLILSFIANLFLLDEIADAFVQIPAVVAIDRSFAKLMFSMRVHWIAEVFYYFTQLGTFWGVVIIAIASTWIFLVKKKTIYILPVWISLLGTQITVQMSKNYFHRMRPEDLWYYKEVSYSFPSGHATVAVAFFGVLFYVIIRSRRSYASKFRWTVAAILFIGLLGFSRLYLCVHYLSDVMAGYSLGLIWLLFAISMSEWMMHRKKIKLKANLNSNR